MVTPTPNPRAPLGGRGDRTAGTSAGADFPTIAAALTGRGLAVDRPDPTTLVVDVPEGNLTLSIAIQEIDGSYLTLRLWPFDGGEVLPESDFAQLLRISDQLHVVKVGLDGGNAVVLSLEYPLAAVDGPAVETGIAYLVAALRACYDDLVAAVVLGDDGDDDADG